MKIMKKTVLLAILLVITVLPVLAEESAPTRISYLKPEAVGGVAQPASAAGPGVDEQLKLRTADFTAFAKVKIKEMNRHLLCSRENMQIRKQADGSYRATYHEIDDTSLSCEVNRSRLRKVPYVAVLSYREQIYAASCATPEQCAQQQFLPVDYIPNRHIFTYSNGSWN
jgi:hypothetical protein